MDIYTLVYRQSLQVNTLNWYTSTRDTVREACKECNTVQGTWRSRDTIIKSLVTSGVSSLLASMNFYSTLTSMRVPGIGLGTVYLFPWTIFMVFILLILMLPVLTGTIGTLVSDIHFNTVYMDPAYGGDPVLYQWTLSTHLLVQILVL